ncbi:50S ribosomal protein L17 [Salinibacter ruber]|uniref:50S ribosomal protein L17 n=1 Tax=Salinibacter ruber TaxID=146919 RepID=UPI0021682F83|nr:50S ribosomal protein L17 [Salinibacter ruber]MCS3635803.1 large subunit ribosomal protein L17 [Salinibacter ruber]MCS3665157.1 large subunit ribosomal protein L17 [Salinibacter ruber]MCS3715324.1 large subunit ribosomal protein L17 [Salinibacter ruber]MCS3749631.1 large subunit ribosomal protein L17 [Salinibacter ruber]MCS4041231.1 large subunit ribosomal protein L17 [Salinibacter ruber]
MRHRKKGKKIGRTASHRKRTLQSLSNALIENKSITTTVAKAKALRPFVEPLITRAKEDTQHNRREVFRHLQSNDAIDELFGEVSERVGDRPGGYTRIIKLGQRSGDGAELALIELVDYNDVPPADTGQGGSGGTRRGSGKGRRTSTEEEADASSSGDSSDEESESVEEDEATAEEASADAEQGEAEEEEESEEDNT